MKGVDIMRMIIWVSVVAFAASYGIFAYTTLDRRSDEAQVTSLFSQAADAIQRRDLSGAIGCVSANYKDPSGLNYDRLRVLTAQALRMEQKFNVDYKLDNVRISGDTASAGVDLTIKGADPNTIVYKRMLTVTLTKESGRHALVIPVKVWRVTSIDNLGLAPEEGI